MKSVIALLGALVVAQACGGSADATPARADTSGAPTSALPIGATVPRYAATTLAGHSLILGDATDSLTLLNVWATWCGSCREEMADLEALRRTYAPRGVRVVAVSVDAGSEQLVRRFIDRQRVSFAVVHDQAGRLQSLYNVVGVPTTYLIGRDGALLWQHTGGLHGSVDLARTAIDAVAESPSPHD